MAIGTPIQMRSPECLCRSLNVSSAMPDLSSSPNPSATIQTYCSLIARQRQIETEAAHKFERDPAIFGGKKPNQ